LPLNSTENLRFGMQYLSLALHLPSRIIVKCSPQLLGPQGTFVSVRNTMQPTATILGAQVSGGVKTDAALHVSKVMQARRKLT
jgi:hypothetical protein